MNRVIKVALLFVNLAVVSSAGNSSGKYYKVVRYISNDCTFCLCITTIENFEFLFK